MPSTDQPAATSDDYDSEPKKMLATKNDLTIAALISGIRKPERAQAYVEAEVALADEDDRDVRKGIVGACNRKKRALDGNVGGSKRSHSETSDHTDDDKKPDTAAKSGRSAENSTKADPEDEGETVSNE